MHKADPNLAIALDTDIAELGGWFVCDVTRSPTDGQQNKSGRGEIRAVRLSLRWYTSGRGDTDSKTVHEVELDVDQYGMAKGRVEMPVPAKAPISYDGDLMRVRWEIVAQTDLAMKIDQKSTADVLVVPVGGLGLYDRAHPLPYASLS